MSLGRKAVNNTLGEKGVSVSLANIVTDGFSVTLAAVIAVWPVVAHYFGVVSLVGPLATFLALPALPAIIAAGTLAGLIGLFALPVAQVIGWLAWLVTSYMLLIVSGLAALPISAIKVGEVDPALIVVYYAIIAAAVWFVSRKKLGERMSKAKVWLKSGAGKATDFASRLPKKWVMPPLLILAILASVAAVTMPDDELRVSFLDVGQGEAILIQKGNQQVLVDGGPTPQALALELGDRMPFWDRTIELVVLTHPHADHLTGLVDVLQRYKVEQVLYPDLDDVLDYKPPLYEEWLGLIEEKDIPYTIAQAGQEIDLGDGVIIKVLHPQTSLLADTGSDINNNSVVLQLTMGKVSFLLTGDIEREAEFRLIAQRAGLASTVLKVSHSGSDTSTTAEFLAVVSPQVAVISVGEGNPFGHPSDEVLERLKAKLGEENIYRTDVQGTIEFITDGKRLWVRVGE
jgi:competence protein ComEC